MCPPACRSDSGIAPKCPSWRRRGAAFPSNAACHRWHKCRFAPTLRPPLPATVVRGSRARPVPSRHDPPPRHPSPRASFLSPSRHLAHRLHFRPTLHVSSLASRVPRACVRACALRLVTERSHTSPRLSQALQLQADETTFRRTACAAARPIAAHERSGAPAPVGARPSMCPWVVV